MKLLILAVLWTSVCCIVVPVNGQPARKNPKAGKTKSANSQPPKINVVDVDTVNVMKFNIPRQPEAAGKADESKKDSQSYFRRLFAPENLPNLILCAIGIAGVFAAVKT